MRAIDITVLGLVQGVYFRVFTKKEANRIGLKGWCKNQADNSVFIHAEGSEDQLEEFVKWCHIGSPASNVIGVEVTESKLLYRKEFLIQKS